MSKAYYMCASVMETVDVAAKSASCHTHVYNPYVTLNSGKPQLARTGSPLHPGAHGFHILSLFYILL